MPPLTPPGLSPSAAPGEVAFAWSSIRGGTGAAMADCANSLGASAGSSQGRMEEKDGSESEE
jgi:hypothetical protein